MSDILKPWRVIKTRVGGMVKAGDRDAPAWPDLHLEMHPIGTQVSQPAPSRELHLTITGSTTILREDGIEALKAFLEERP